MNNNKLNRLNIAGVEALIGMLAQCQTLQTLYLGRNDLGELDDVQFQAFSNMVKTSGAYRIINFC